MFSKYVVQSEILPGHGENRRIVFSTRTQRSFILTSECISSIEAGEPIASDELRNALDEAKVIVKDNNLELQEVVCQSRAAIATQDVLYECIQPTSWCNFGCGYCGQEHSRKWMSPAVQTNVVERLRSKAEQKDYRLLKIGWFGGEPLLAMPVIRSLTSQLYAVVAEHGMSYEAHMVTNGYALTRVRTQELVEELGVSHLEITVDGPPEHHNIRRALKNGGGTFEKVWQNLRDALEVSPPGVSIALRCNVDRQNADDMPALIQAVAMMAGRKPMLYFAPVHDWANEAGKTSLDKKSFAELEVEWITLMLAEGLPVSLLPAAKPIVCMAVSPHAGLVEADGTRQECSELAILPKRLNARTYDFAGFLSRVESNALPCSTCEMLPVCGGACPKSWIDGKVPCPSAKFNLADRLKLAYATSAIR